MLEVFNKWWWTWKVTHEYLVISKELQFHMKILGLSTASLFYWKFPCDRINVIGPSKVRSGNDFDFPPSKLINVLLLT